MFSVDRMEAQIYHIVYFCENFNLSKNARAFIFHMNIPFENIFLLILNLLTLTYIFNKINIYNNKIINIRAFIMHMSISCDKIFLLISRYLSLWPSVSLEFAIIGGICASQTHLVLVLHMSSNDKAQTWKGVYINVRFSNVIKPMNKLTNCAAQFLTRYKLLTCILE